MKKERTKCEVYTRVVWYMRPVDQFNDAKKSEYFDRKVYVIDSTAQARVVEP
jgi:ribonucleoside-triphosphate reductase (formate)